MRANIIPAHGSDMDNISVVSGGCSVIPSPSDGVAPSQIENVHLLSMWNTTSLSVPGGEIINSETKRRSWERRAIGFGFCVIILLVL